MHQPPSRRASNRRARSLVTVCLALCLALALPAQAASPSPRAEALEMLASDPDGAITRLLALQDAPGEEEAVKNRVALLFAYQQARRRDEGMALVGRILDAPPPAPTLEALQIKQVLDCLFLFGDTSLLPIIEPRVQALAGQDEAPAEDRARVLHALGALQTRVPRLDDAIANLDAALALFGDQASAAKVSALSAKGGIHAMQGQFPPALEALQQADATTLAMGLPGDANVLRNLAGLYINLGEMDRAIEYATRAEAVQREVQPPPTPLSRHGVLSVLATAHIGAGNFELGQQWSRAAIDYGLEHGLRVSSNLSNYATLLRDNGRIDEALAIYRQLNSQLKPGDDAELRGVVEKNIGESLVLLGRREEAAHHLQAAREIYAVAKVPPKQLELFPVLIENLEALGRTAEALAAMHEYKALSDETISADSKTRIGELESTLELERKNQALAESEAANALQRAENDALQAEQARAHALNLALLAGVLSLLAVLALLWRTHRLRVRSHRELAALNATIQQQNLEDSLTGLGNRRLLQSQMESGSPASGLLVMADLDHFKRVNDLYGHEAGDRALAQFADALRAVARHDDLLVRWGGEEFVWLCRGADVDQGPALCERLRRQLRERPLEVSGGTVPITASLGFVPLPVWPESSADWELALRIADHGVYCSKSAGRNRWTGFAGGPSGPGNGGLAPEALLQQGALQQLGAPA